MASDKDFKIKEKKKQAIILLVVLFIPMCVALFFTGQFFNEKNVTDQETLGSGVLSNIVSHMDTMSLAAVSQYNSNLSKRMNVRVSFLREDVKNGKYVGPHVFSDGFVIRLNGDRILYPVGAPRGEMKVTPQLITTSIASGQMRTGRLTTNINSHHSLSGSKPVEDDTEADSAPETSSGNTADTGLLRMPLHWKISI